jgi:hypothetical protein
MVVSFSHVSLPPSSSFPSSSSFSFPSSFPKNGWNECPSGMLARGKYSAVATFTDSDKVDHSQFKYTLKITK